MDLRPLKPNLVGSDDDDDDDNGELRSKTCIIEFGFFSCLQFINGSSIH